MISLDYTHMPLSHCQWQICMSQAWHVWFMYVWIHPSDIWEGVKGGIHGARGWSESDKKWDKDKNTHDSRKWRWVARTMLVKIKYTFHLVLAKVFNICALTDGCIFLSRAVLPEILSTYQIQRSDMSYMALHEHTRIVATDSNTTHTEHLTMTHRFSND